MSAGRLDIDLPPRSLVAAAGEPHAPPRGTLEPGAGTDAITPPVDPDCDDDNRNCRDETPTTDDAANVA